MSVRIRGEAAEVALGEAHSLLAVLVDAARRERLAALVAAVHEGDLDEDAQAVLEEILELGLASGRIRARYSPEGEQAALGLYRRLPGGRALTDGARELTASLAELEGKPLEQISIQATGPGAFLLTVAAGGRELTVRFDRAGVRLHAVAV